MVVRNLFLMEEFNLVFFISAGSLDRNSKLFLHWPERLVIKRESPRPSQSWTAITQYLKTAIYNVLVPILLSYSKPVVEERFKNIEYRVGFDRNSYFCSHYHSRLFLLSLCYLQKQGQTGIRLFTKIKVLQMGKGEMKDWEQHDCFTGIAWFN